MMAMQELVVPKSMPRIFAIYPIPRRMWADATVLLQESYIEMLAQNNTFEQTSISSINSDKTSQVGDRMARRPQDVSFLSLMYPNPADNLPS
jgi:hypothetical protein